jgi:predicted RND superfamily exporter protein
MERNTNISAFFKKGNSTRVSEEILQTKFGDSSPVFIEFKGDIQSPELLKKMSEMEEVIKQNPYVSTTTSVAALIEELNNAMGEGYKIPDEKAKIEQLWFLIDGQDVMQQLVSENLDAGVIQSRFASNKSTDTEAFIKSINEYIQKNSTPDCKISLNGMPSIYRQMDKSLLNRQMSSLALAIVFVFFLIGFSLKSFKMGFYGIMPIFATIILLFGFMGIAQIPLDIATVLVASVALGIGIDYSIHIISSFNFYFNQTGNVHQAMEKTILISGKAIIINAISVAAGFLVLLFSQIVPIQFFGLLIAISMFSSAFGALTLLPIIIILRVKSKQ